MEDLVPAQQGGPPGDWQGGGGLAWKAEDRGRLRAPCEGLSPAQEGDPARQEVEASQQEDDIIRCVF